MGNGQQADDQTRISLSPVEFDTMRRDAWLSRQSYRTFIDDMIPFDKFSNFLSCLTQMPIEHAPLPKYLYPSAGNLYPVQAYLYLKPGRIKGLSGGFYYHNPQHHRLVSLIADDETVSQLCAGSNHSIFEEAAFALFLVADLDAITPLYGEIARDFSLLEAGHMSQLLMMEAPQHQLGLCPIGGGLDLPRVQRALMLGENHQILPNSLLGGRIAPIQRTQWLGTGPQARRETESSAETASWQTELRSYLLQKLPDYMIPTTYVLLDFLPLTANGKIDRKALPIPDLNPTQSAEFTPPRNDTEQSIADIWCDLLELKQVGIHDDFFSLGGDSFVVMQLKTRLYDLTQIDLSLRTFFTNSTINQLAEEINDYRIALKMQSGIVNAEKRSLKPESAEMDSVENEIW